MEVPLRLEFWAVTWPRRRRARRLREGGTWSRSPCPLSAIVRMSSLGLASSWVTDMGSLGMADDVYEALFVEEEGVDASPRLEIFNKFGAFEAEVVIDVGEQAVRGTLHLFDKVFAKAHVLPRT